MRTIFYGLLVVNLVYGAWMLTERNPVGLLNWGMSRYMVRQTRVGGL